MNSLSYIIAFSLLCYSNLLIPYGSASSTVDRGCWAILYLMTPFFIMMNLAIRIRPYSEKT